MAIINKKRLIFNIISILLVFFLNISTLFSITVPEGIRGFTVTYGAWIESVLSKSILKDALFQEDQEQYDKLQRLIITSERLSEEGNHKDALSFLRRAEFFLEDIENTLGRKYGWTKEDYTLEEMKAWSDNARESWVMLSYQRISLLLQYEYFHILNNNPDPAFFENILKAMKLYNELNKNTKTFRKLQTSSLFNYLSRIEESWNISIQHQKNFSVDKMMEYLSTHSDEFLMGSGYWKRKFIKRSAILLGKYGYPEKAMILLNHLMEDKSDTLPVEVVFNLMIFNGKFSEAEKYLIDNINTLNTTEVDKWGIYIKYKNKLLSLYLLLKKYQVYEFENDKFIAKMEKFSQRIDLSADIFEYVVYQLNNAILNKRIMASMTLQPSVDSGQSPAILITEFTPDDIRYKKLTFESYKNTEIEIPDSSPYLIYRKFQIDFKNGQLAEASRRLNKLTADYSTHYLTIIAKLQYRLKTNFRSNSREWYELWLESVYNSIENPFELISINHGLKIDFDIESEFLNFLSLNPNIFSTKDLGNLLYAVSMLSTWNNRIISPPVYYQPEDYRLMYKYFSRWGFRLSEEPDDQNIMSMVFFDQIEKHSFCTSGHNCWILYPVKDKIYSFMISEDSVSQAVLNQSASTLIPEIGKFYAAIEKQSQLQSLSGNLQTISQAFQPALEQLARLNISQTNRVYLFTYKYTSLFPIEAFYTPDEKSHVGDTYQIIRKMPVDQSFAVSCKDSGCIETAQQDTGNTEGSNYFFIGVGNTNPGFIIANPSLDEILDIEGLFSTKKLLSDSGNLAGNLAFSLEKSKNNILHIAGEWKDMDNFPAIIINNKNNAIGLDNFKFMENLPYLVFSKNRSSNFSEKNYFNWEKVLTTFRYKHTEIIITSMATSSKEFRQAFFYDMYYKIIHKKNPWITAFFSAMERTKKGFPKSIWPYLMVVYEK